MRRATPRVAGERKLSEIIKELACRVLRQPDVRPSFAGAESAVMLAAAAWNAALGDSPLRERHREMLRRLRSLGDPLTELRSPDTDRLIAELVEYKQEHLAEDRRHIMACGANPEFDVSVQWMYEADWLRVVPGAAALLRSGAGAHAAAAKPVAAAEDGRSAGRRAPVPTPIDVRESPAATPRPGGRGAGQAEARVEAPEGAAGEERTGPDQFGAGAAAGPDGPPGGAQVEPDGRPGEVAGSTLPEGEAER